MNYHHIYNSIISRAITRSLIGYSELHHIIPRCMKGSDESSNLVSLTPEEHVLCHLLLVKMFPDNEKLIYAANMMTNRIKNNKQYGWVKRQFSIQESINKTGVKRSQSSVDKQRRTLEQKYKSGYTNHRKGTTISADHKSAISAANTGKLIKPEAKSDLFGHIIRYGEAVGTQKYNETCQKKATSLDNMIKKYGAEAGKQKYTEMNIKRSCSNRGENNSMFGRSHTDEARQKISKSNIGKSKVRTAEHNKKIGLANKKPHKQLSCPHCNKCGGAAAMKKWHFNNCKFIRNH